MSDNRKIRFNGEELGEYKWDALYRARMRGDFDHTAEFFSEKKQQWLPLAGIVEDLDSTVTMEQSIKQIKQAGFEKVQFLTADNGGDCPICKALAEKTYSIEEVPTIPPQGCTCKPWCMLVLDAKE